MSGELYEELHNLLKVHDEIVIITMGNELRADDAIGVDIGLQLREHLSNMLDRILVTYTVPVNYVNKIIRLKPKKLLFIDSTEMNAKPGEVILCDPSNLQSTQSFTTHYQELEDLLAYIDSQLEYTPDIYILGIQVKSVEIAEPISAEVRAAADIVIDMITKILQVYNLEKKQ